MAKGIFSEMISRLAHRLFHTRTQSLLMADQASDHSALLEMSRVITALLTRLPLSEVLAEATRQMTLDGCTLFGWEQQAEVLSHIVDFTPTFPRPHNTPNRHQQTQALLSAYPRLNHIIAHQTPEILAGQKLSDPLLNQNLPCHDVDAWDAWLIIPLHYQKQPLGLLTFYVLDTRQRPLTTTDLAYGSALQHPLTLALQGEILQADKQQISQRLVTTQEAERRRISRELHDELGQALTALKINLDVVNRLLSKDPEAAPSAQQAKIQHSLDEARSLAVHTLEVARNMSGSLRPVMLDDLGLEAVLRWTLDRYEQRTGQTVQLEIDLRQITLPSDIAISLYRIINEALTNSARHAQAGRVWVALFVEKGEVVALVNDNGLGFEVDAWRKSARRHESQGLQGMQERATLLGGSLTITSKPGHGTQLEVRLPLPDSAEKDKAQHD